LEVLNTVFLFRAYHILKHYRKCRAVLDLGANIGIASRFFAQELPDVHIVAVEPSSDNCGIYEKNLAIELQAGRVRLLRCAVGAKDGDGCIDVGKNVRFDSFKIVKAEKIYHSGSESCLPVKILGMKHLVRLLDGPLLVKIDIEGSEQELLEVRDEWIAFANCLMIEFHNRLQEDVWIRTLTNEGWDAAKFFDTWHFARVQQN
jgi:FkbM family methyltransferase